jgi:hypothetical protein
VCSLALVGLGPRCLWLMLMSMPPVRLRSLVIMGMPNPARAEFRKKGLRGAIA